MKILSLIARLLDYPTDLLGQNRSEVASVILDDTHLTHEDKNGLLMFVKQRLNADLLDWQAEYEGLFERGRSLSLLIYEHIHGESRYRGQAMVNLAEQYKKAGLDIGVRELPDYIPLFLEFVSTQGKENAKGWLQDIAPILALLAVRLEKRQCNYASLFNALVNLSGVKIDKDTLYKKVAEEKRDDTKKALDKVWEEEAVTFGGDAVNGGCPSNASKPSESQRRDQDVPIQFIDAAQSNLSSKELRS